MKLNINHIAMLLFCTTVAQAASQTTIDQVEYDIIDMVPESARNSAVMVSLPEDSSSSGIWMTLEKSDGTQSGWQHIMPGGNYIFPRLESSSYTRVIAPTLQNQGSQGSQVQARSLQAEGSSSTKTDIVVSFNDDGTIPHTKPDDAQDWFKRIPENVWQKPASTHAEKSDYVWFQSATQSVTLTIPNDIAPP
ncbi:hypothetical protein [Candidatus Finniella inopinata]|uniref:Uncharacterized protein n=1 Tax=Candidatus Finniella inopinata TaxID=1696036 RepID=A0A4Q7DIT7_9PROT|nr:hypothetical protein [Candidatus Finniella inopinata]RZI46891.1 hypothetical protein EQU50_01315 [Candidatus Finniella inopinata]